MLAASANTSFLRLEPPLFQATLQTNLSGAFYTIQAAARQMALHNSPPGGSIIGISSISALVGGGLQTHYTPTKAGVLSLMQSTAVALGKYNIRCNALLPGTIRTQLNEVDMQDEKKRTYMEGRIPLGRLGQPEDMAGPAVFLACDGLSGYMVRRSSCLLWRFVDLVIHQTLRLTHLSTDRCTDSGGWRTVCQSTVVSLSYSSRASNVDF